MKARLTALRDVGPSPVMLYRATGVTRSYTQHLVPSTPKRHYRTATLIGALLRSGLAVLATFRVEPCGIMWSEGKQHGVVYRLYRALRVHGRDVLTFAGQGLVCPDTR